MTCYYTKKPKIRIRTRKIGDVGDPIREDPLSTYAKFLGFWTPSPLSYAFHATYQYCRTQIFLAVSLTPPLPLGEYVHGWSLTNSVHKDSQKYTQYCLIGTPFIFFIFWHTKRHPDKGTHLTIMLLLQLGCPKWTILRVGHNQTKTIALTPTAFLSASISFSMLRSAVSLWRCCSSSRFASVSLSVLNARDREMNLLCEKRSAF